MDTCLTKLRKSVELVELFTVNQTKVSDRRRLLYSPSYNSKVILFPDFTVILICIRHDFFRDCIPSITVTTANSAIKRTHPCTQNRSRMGSVCKVEIEKYIPHKGECQEVLVAKMLFSAPHVAVQLCTTPCTGHNLVQYVYSLT